MKASSLFLFLFLFLTSALSTSAGEYQSRESQVLKNPKNFTMSHTVESFCLEGHVFVEVAIVGGGAGAGVSVIQVYEEKDGEIVPKRCEPKEQKK
jgi:hypothetical protein